MKKEISQEDRDFLDSIEWAVLDHPDDFLSEIRETCSEALSDSVGKRLKDLSADNYNLIRRIHRLELAIEEAARVLTNG